jgi:hypothetical protein
MRTLGGVLSALLLPAAIMLGSPAAILLGSPAARADIGPDQAQALTSQLKDWLRGMVGPSAPLPDLRATAEGDHYLLTVPITALEGPDKDVTAKLRPLDAGRWAADDIRLPADTRLTAKMPPRPGQTEPTITHLHVTIAGQNSHGVLDPAMTTVSTLVSSLRGIVIDGDGGGRPQSQRFDTYDQTLTLHPAASGKLDIDEDGTADGWKSVQLLPNGVAMATGAKRISGDFHVVGLDRPQAATLGPVLSALASAPTPDRNERLRALVVALHGLFSSIKFDETIEAMQIAVTGQGDATIDKVHLGFDSAAPEGNLATSLSLGLDGLTLPALTATSASLAPKHVKVGVSLAGVSTEALNNLALAALTPGSNATTLAPQIDALFADVGKTGGPRIGIDTLGFDVGPAQIDSHGSIVAVSQSDIRGTARITVTGYDALVDQLRTDPQLQQALPFLILARGMSRSEGKALIWDIVFTPTGLTVNGVDPRTLLQQPKRPRGQP